MQSGLAKTPPARDQLAEHHKWRLEDIYPTDQKWEEDFRSLQQQCPALAGFQGKLGESWQKLLECLELREQMGETLERLYVYAHMRKDEDNNQVKYQAMADRVMGLSVKIQSITAYIVPEILGLSEEQLQSWMNQPEMALYRHFLEDMVRLRPHTLSAQEEELVAQVGELATAPKTVYRMLINADTKFPIIKDEKGEDIEVSEAKYTHLLRSRDRRVRQDAFAALLGAYKDKRNTIAGLLSTSVKKDIFYSRVRKYPSALEAALKGDNIPLEVYYNLIKTVRENLDLLHNYVKLRKRLLGLQELRMYDLYVPMVSQVDIQVPFDEAKKMVLESVEPLGQEYLAALREGLQGRWIDVFENKGKTSGAYAWGAYGTHPFVLLNYQDSLDGVFTLAHEMGHALHTYYSSREQPYIYAHYTIFTAEVASTVNEALLLHYLLGNREDPKERLYLLNYYLEQFRGTVFRQTMFAEFEKIIHEKAEAGEALTPDVLSGIYYQLNMDYYGPHITVDQDIEIEWARIPHFYSAFYVYKYATGFSAATALSRQVLGKEEGAVDRYLGFLKSGSSDYSINILQRAGVDMTSPEPVKKALEVFAETLRQMEEIAN
ncbi:MAG: oligoendopeptidase F [Bacillota bacterium]